MSHSLRIAAPVFALFAAALHVLGCDCKPNADCDDAVVVRGKIEPSTIASVPSLRVEGCRNGACSSGMFALSTYDDGYASARMLGDALVRASLSRDGDTGDWQLSAIFEPEDGGGVFEDGDRVMVRAVDVGSGVVVVDVDEVVNYETDAPDGEWCGPICEVAEIDFSAAE